MGFVKDFNDPLIIDPFLNFNGSSEISYAKLLIIKQDEDEKQKRK